MVSLTSTRRLDTTNIWQSEAPNAYFNLGTPCESSYKAHTQDLLNLFLLCCRACASAGLSLSISRLLWVIESLWSKYECRSMHSLAFE